MPPHAQQQHLQQHLHHAPPASSAAANASPLTASEVRRLDEAHEQAWQSLAASAGAPDVLVAPATAASSASERLGHLDPEGLEQAYRDTLSVGFAEEQQRLLEQRLRDHARADVASAADGVSSQAFEELEAAWKGFSVADLAREGGQELSVSQAAELEKIWKGLSGGDYMADLQGMEEAWAGLGGDVSLGESFEASLDAYDDAHAPYRFHADNPYLGQANLRERGTELFRNGELTEAVLALEAAVQDQPEDTLAWQTLGMAHADADDDHRAIACLRRAVAADPHNLDALLALGVSYTNELDQTRALKHLQLWLESHPDFIDIPSAAGGGAAGGLDVAWGRAQQPQRPQPGGSLGEYENPFELQRRVTDLFLRAVEKRPANADLRAVLGVLYNLSRSYPEAIASFEAALKLRPDDYSLWNKLGATKANAMSCAEAVPCYIRALELKPNYGRALSNLGISYGNMANYEAAAQCYLRALSLNHEAAHIWGYLNMTFSSMGRLDLVTKAAASPKADPAIFKDDFDF